MPSTRERGPVRRCRSSAPSSEPPVGEPDEAARKELARPEPVPALPERLAPDVDQVLESVQLNAEHPIAGDQPPQLDETLLAAASRSQYVGGADYLIGGRPACHRLRPPS